MLKLIAFITEHLQLDIDINADTQIREVANDSLELIELIISLEEYYETEISDELIDQMITIQDIYNYVVKPTLKEDNISSVMSARELFTNEGDSDIER